jgi:endonuclease/exonuclease/phosphatase family metal-dependent hydrolase
MPPPARAGAPPRGARRLTPSPLAILLAVSSVLALPASGAASAEDGRLRVMTYNVRAAVDAPPRDWSSRLRQMKEMLREERPDLLGVQEPMWGQMRDLAAALPGYGWIGLGCAGGTRSEFEAIFYRRSRFQVLEFDHFWLSDTPMVIGSATWGNSYIRMVTWAKFRDRRTGRVFYQVNTHLDESSENARVKSAVLILRRVRGFQRGVPVILTGDFNAAAGGSEPYRLLTGPDAFADTWKTAARRGPAYGTLGDWRPPVPGADRLDWVLTRGAARTDWTKIVTYRKGGRYPSDHFPVIARLSIGA